MSIWVAVIAFSQLLEGSLKFTFVCRMLITHIRMAFSWFFFSILHQIRGNGKGLKVSKPHFFGKIWFICNISKKVHNCFQRWFLNFLDRFVIRFLRKCFFSKLFLTSILQKVPTWENFSPWIKKIFNQ